MQSYSMHGVKVTKIEFPTALLERIEAHVDFMRYQNSLNLLCAVMLDWIEKKDESIRDHMAYLEKVRNLEPGARFKKR